MINQLLKALTCDPNDTLAWVALADALEEAGESERAELTRLRTNPESQKRVQELLLSGVKPCVPTFTNSIGMELTLIPAGKFIMGSPESEEGRCYNEKQHEVEITKPFWMGVYPVTQEEYESVIGDNPSNSKGERLPVEMVSWYDAVEFCKKLSERPGERVYRLPTEAEWEYACRAGTTTAYNLGDDEDALHEAGWHCVNNNDDVTYQVGRKKPNAWGLYDMHGNVYEWCLNWYGEGNPHASVPRRGGCLLEGRTPRSAYRGWSAPRYKFSWVGFRAVSNIG